MYHYNNLFSFYLHELSSWVCVVLLTRLSLGRLAVVDWASSGQVTWCHTASRGLHGDLPSSAGFASLSKTSGFGRSLRVCCCGLVVQCLLSTELVAFWWPRRTEGSTYGHLQDGEVGGSAEICD